MNELVSIVVPIYNVEPYLYRCVNSILEQDYTTLEVILVDDGSPDNCGAICDEYSQLDSRVKVIHKKNGGLSDARNAGLAVATGNYIAFIDSDDWIATDYISTMLNLMLDTGCDICECGVIKTTGMVNHDDSNDIEATSYDRLAALSELIYDKNLKQHVWNKLYTRDCIKQELFPVGKTNEDEFWTYRVFGNANKVVQVNKVLYYYFQRESSIMGVGYNLKRLDALEAKNIRQEYIEKNFPELSDIAKCNLFASCIYSGQMILKHLNSADRQIAQDVVNGIQKKNHPHRMDANLTVKERLWIYLAKINFWFTCRVKNLLRKGF